MASQPERATETVEMRDIHDNGHMGSSAREGPVILDKQHGIVIITLLPMGLAKSLCIFPFMTCLYPPTDETDGMRVPFLTDDVTPSRKASGNPDGTNQKTIKSNGNMFAKRRHMAQTFLDIALLVNNVSHFVSVWMTDTPGDLRRILLGLIVTSIVLQVMTALILFHVTCLYHLVENRELTIMHQKNQDPEENPAAEVEVKGQGYCRWLWYSSVDQFETAIIILDWLATAIILVITILNVFISAFFQLQTNLKTQPKQDLVFKTFTSLVDNSSKEV